MEVKAVENDTSDSLSRLLSGMERGAKKNNNSLKFPVWQPKSHPMQLTNIQMAHQKLDYIHYNSVEARFNFFVSTVIKWK
jgi:hypothetical protein